MDEELNTYRQTAGALLVDVRSPQEYAGGHVPGSVNVPVEVIGQMTSVCPKKDTPLFVYCHSGVRSAQACSALERAGYTDVNDLGGIIDYHGPIER